MNSEIEQAQGKPLSPKQIRMFGLGIAVCGFITTGVFIALPVYQAMKKVENVTVFKYGLIAGVILFFSGMNLAVFGKKTIDLIPSEYLDLKEMTVWHWLVFIINVGVAVVIIYFLSSYLNNLGYKT